MKKVIFIQITNILNLKRLMQKDDELDDKYTEFEEYG